MKMTKAEFIAECARRRAEGLKLFGGYEQKDKIKAAGGIWDARLKCWLIPSAQVAVSLGARSAEGRYGSYFTLSAPRASTSNPPRRSCRGERYFVPCGYPGCNRSYCDDCDGHGAKCNCW